MSPTICHLVLLDEPLSETQSFEAKIMEQRNKCKWRSNKCTCTGVLKELESETLNLLAKIGTVEKNSLVFSIIR